MKLENCWNLLEHRTLDARRAESPGLIVNARSEIGVLVLWSLCAQCWISGTYAREPSLAAVIPVAPGGVFVRRTSSAAAGAPPSQDMDLAAARLLENPCPRSGATTEDDRHARNLFLNHEISMIKSTEVTVCLLLRRNG